MADSKKKRPRRRFGDEFKREAAALYRSSDVSAEQVGAELGLHFTNVERMRKLGDMLDDSYSLLYSESHPDTMSGCRDCLDKSIERMGTKTRLVFDDWVKLVEKRTEDSDLLTWHVEAHVDISTKLSGFVLGSGPPIRKCAMPNTWRAPNKIELKKRSAALATVVGYRNQSCH